MLILLCSGGGRGHRKGTEESEKGKRRESYLPTRCVDGEKKKDLKLTGNIQRLRSLRLAGTLTKRKAERSWLGKEKRHIPTTKEMVESENKNERERTDCSNMI